jgi:hypothetical protein
MNMRLPAIPLLCAAFFSAALLPQRLCAEEAAAGRFQLQPTEGGVVRLDTRTGAMTLCRNSEGELICRMAADERAAYEEELDRIERRVAALEGRNASAIRPPPAPSDAEIDRSIGIMERFMRSFMGLVDEFRWRQDGSSPGGRT